MVNYHQKRVRVNYHYFVVMDNGWFPYMLRGGSSSLQETIVGQVKAALPPRRPRILWHIPIILQYIPSLLLYSIVILVNAPASYQDTSPRYTTGYLIPQKSTRGFDTNRWGYQWKSIPRGMSRQRVHPRTLYTSLILSGPIPDTRGTHCWPGITHIRDQYINGRPNICQ